MNNTLYLASQSAIRRHILTQAGYDVQLVRQHFDELSFPFTCDPVAYVKALAAGKNENAERGAFATAEKACVVSADTVLYLPDLGVVLGKPRDHAHAHEMLGLLCAYKTILVTGMAVTFWANGVVQRRETCASEVEIQFHVPPAERELYLEKTPEAFFACGATAIEGFGIRYLAFIAGSWSAALGVDIPKLRNYLEV